MTKLMIMRDEVKKLFGEESKEFGWMAFVFANRPTEYFIRVYNDLMAA
jgi:hypothetical protein